MDGRAVRALMLAAACGCGPEVAGGEAEGGSDEASTTTSGSATTSGTTSVGTTASTVTTATVTTAADSGPAETGMVLDLPPGDTDSCLEWAYEGCAFEAPPDATVAGTTPLGEFDTPYAFFGAYTRCGDCVETNVGAVTLVADPMGVADLNGGGIPGDGLVLVFDWNGFTGPLGTPVAGEVFAARNGQEEMIGDAALVLDALPDPAALAVPYSSANAVIVNGSVDLEAPGWSLHGDFGARYCPQLNFYAICE
jgi:hypothetical protein